MSRSRASSFVIRLSSVGHMRHRIHKKQWLGRLAFFCASCDYCGYLQKVFTTDRILRLSSVVCRLSSVAGNEERSTTNEYSIIHFSISAFQHFP